MATPRVTDRIAEGVTLQKLTKNELDRLIGSDTGYTSKIIREGRNPGADKIAKIAEALETSADWLMSGRGSPPPPPDWSVSDRVGEALRARKMSPLELDIATENQRGYTSKVLAHERNPKPYLETIAAALGVTVDWLKQGREPGDELEPEPDARALVRAMPWYANEPRHAREVFEAIDRRDGATMSVEDWRNLYFDVLAQFRAHEDSGQPLNEFRFDPRRRRDRPPGFSPRPSKLPTRKK